MPSLRAFALCLLLASLPAAAADAPASSTGDSVLVRNATIFDGSGRTPFAGDVLVRDGRIAAVGRGLRAPEGVRVLDAHGDALLPGLIDVHTHWTPGGTPSTFPAIANAYLAAGVTTVNDFNEAPEAFAPARDWLRQLAAPNVRFAARISTPLGHGADWADQATTRWVNSPAAARAAVDADAAYGPDLVKAFTDGWRYDNAPDNTSMDEATLAALVDEAHRKGLEVMTHTVTVARGKIAVRAGVDVLAHSLLDRPVDDELVRLMREHRTSYTGTLAVYEPVRLGDAPPKPDDPVVAQRRRNFANALANMRTLHDAGIRIVLGTDAGMPGTPHGAATLHELELMVRAGLTPAQALRAGTSDGAAALGLDDRGLVAVGRRADLVLVRGRPWRDVSDMHHVERVFVGGRELHGPDAVLPPGNRADAPPPVRIGALVDDFERADGRTALDTLRTTSADGGNDRTTQLTQVVPREDGDGHALSTQAQLSYKAKPYAGVVLPLRRGALAPADVSGYRGIRFDIRGQAGDLQLELHGVDGRRWANDVALQPGWRTLSIPFGQLRALPPWRGKRPATPWSGRDVEEVVFQAGGAPGDSAWFELDNVRFY